MITNWIWISNVMQLQKYDFRLHLYKDVSYIIKSLLCLDPLQILCSIWILDFKMGSEKLEQIQRRATDSSFRWLETEIELSLVYLIGQEPTEINTRTFFNHRCNTKMIDNGKYDKNSNCSRFWIVALSHMKGYWCIKILLCCSCLV